MYICSPVLVFYNDIQTCYIHSAVFVPNPDPPPLCQQTQLITRPLSSASLIHSTTFLLVSTHVQQINIHTTVMQATIRTSLALPPSLPPVSVHPRRVRPDLHLGKPGLHGKFPTGSLQMFTRWISSRALEITNAVQEYIKTVDILFRHPTFDHADLRSNAAVGVLTTEAEGSAPGALRLQSLHRGCCRRASLRPCALHYLTTMLMWRLVYSLAISPVERFMLAGVQWESEQRNSYGW